MTYLLDSSVLTDALNGRNGRPQLLAQLSQQDVLLACCAVNVTELHMGMRRGEEAKTGKLLRSLEFYPVTFEIAQLAGDLFRRWRQRGHTLGLADVTIAAVALTHGLVLVTDNPKHFPMPELRVLQLPDPAAPRKSGRHR
jgi:toxin FitB